MAGAIRIFNDIQQRSLVKSFSDTTPATFPTFFQGETPTVQLYFLDPTGSTSIPYSYVGLSGASIKVAIIAGNPGGGGDVAIAYQNRWTNIVNISGGFTAGITCSTVGISNALGSNASVACTAEIEVTEIGGTPVKYFQGPMTIKAAVIDSATVAPQPAS